MGKSNTGPGKPRCDGDIAEILVKGEEGYNLQ
jgi:hypothetical protein